MFWPRCIFRHKLHVPVTESPFQGKWVNWLEPGLVSNAKRRLQFTRQFNQLKLHRKDFPPISPSSSFPHNSNSFTTWTGRGNVFFLLGWNSNFEKWWLGRGESKRQRRWLAKRGSLQCTVLHTAAQCYTQLHTLCNAKSHSCTMLHTQVQKVANSGQKAAAACLLIGMIHNSAAAVFKTQMHQRYHLRTGEWGLSNWNSNCSRSRQPSKLRLSGWVKSLLCWHFWRLECKNIWTLVCKKCATKQRRLCV